MLNEELYEDLSSAELFITMFYIKYDMESRILTYASAGHNRPLLFRPGSSSCKELDAEGLILGVKRDVLFEENTIQLHEGDMLLMYTDGVTEAQNASGNCSVKEGSVPSFRRLTLNIPIQIIDRILFEVTAFTDQRPLKDDVSFVLIKDEQ